MMKHLNFFLVLLALLVWNMKLSAQPYCDARTFNIHDGLVANVISGIDQSPDGLMWFATYKGLCCYDGYRFTNFHNAKGSELLSTNRIAQIKVEGNAGVWVITYDRQLYFFDTHKCEYIDVSERVKKKFGREFNARNIYCLPQSHHTWITGEKGAYCLRVMNGDMESLSLFLNRQLSPYGTTIRKVIADQMGGEWILSDQSIMRWQNNHEQLRQRGKFQCLAEVGEQVFLAKASGELYVYNKGASQLQRIPLMPEPQQINCLASGPGGTLLIGTSNGLLSLKANTCKTTILASGVGSVSAIYCDRRNRIWAFTYDGNVLLSNGKPSSFSVVKSECFDPNPTASRYPIWVEDKEGTIWMVPENGVFSYYDEESGILRSYTLRSRGYDYDNLPRIDKFFIDQQHNLWCATTHDLTLLNMKYRHIKQIALARDWETRALVARNDGTVWVGSHKGFIAVFSADGRLQGYVDQKGRIVPQPVKLTDRVYAMKQDSKGRVWVGTKGCGLFLIGSQGIAHYTHNPNDKYSLSHNDIYDIDEDELGNIWIGTYSKGLNLVETQADGSVCFVNAFNRLKNYPINKFGKIRRITHTGKGVVILSTTTGLLTMSNRFKDPSAIRFYASEHLRGDTTSIRTSDVMQALATKKGTVYVTTMGGNIQRLTSRNLLAPQLRFHTPANQNGGNALSLVEDSKGKVWVVRESSLEMFTPFAKDSGITFEYSSKDLDEHAEFTEALPALSADGKQLWLPSISGVFMLNPTKQHRSQFKPTIVFTSVQFQGEALPQPLLNTPELVVPADKRSFTISFAALDYQDNSLVRYAYKLKGIDQAWNYVGQEHQAQLTQLPAGHHCLIVKSTNSDGVWMENETELNIYIQPTFWETTWAKLLYVLLFMGLIGIGIHIYLLRRKNAMQREMDVMKTRFYTRASHKLRTPLTLIGGPVTEVLAHEHLTEKGRQHLEIVQRNSRNMLDLVNKMLDHSKTRNFIVDDKNAPTFVGSQSFIDADAETGQHKDVKLLVVEDNNDLRAFLVSILQDDYCVLDAANGRIGLEMALSEQPDFIITDVMMPEMDGLTMVRQIKQNPNICHIPIIVLSAKASLDDRLEGLKAGIDDYITKPFSATYLRQRIENIISLRRMLQQNWLGSSMADGKHKEYKLETPHIVDADQQMMEQLMKYIESRIDDENLKIEDMAEAVHLGRTVFYGKIKALVGMAPFDFLRHVRMQRAEDLVAKSKMSFSQIAYAVGFTDPKYFTKCFKKETGMTPSEYREKERSEEVKSE